MKSVVFFILMGALSASGCVKTAPPAPAHGHKKLDQTNEVWVCPMHPQVRESKPGRCPICGMDLVKADTEPQHVELHGRPDPEGRSTIQLSPLRQQMIGVKFGVVEKKLVFKSIEASGRVAFDPELYTAQNEYIEALRQLERVKETPLADVKHSAERMVESAKLRLKILGLSDQQISRLRSAGAGPSGSNLLMPSPGESVWVYAEVFEMDLAHVMPGLEARISGGALEGKTLIGKVISVDRVINPLTRTAKVRIQVPNAKAQLRPEAFVEVNILSPLGEQIVVPFDAVFDSGKESWVFVVADKGTFEPRLVQVKYSAGDEVAIAEGLGVGEKIVTSANFLIDSESRLKREMSHDRKSH